MRCCTWNPKICLNVKFQWEKQWYKGLFSTQNLHYWAQCSFSFNTHQALIPPLTFLMSLKMLYPSMKASPDVTLSSPVSILNVVVFPAPLKPRRPKHSPFPTARDSLSTARRLSPLLYTWDGQIAVDLYHNFTYQDTCLFQHWEGKLHTLLSSCSMSGLPTIDSTNGWHSRTLFLSSATSLSSGWRAASSVRGNWGKKQQQRKTKTWSVRHSPNQNQYFSFYSLNGSTNSVHICAFTLCVFKMFPFLRLQPSHPV